MIEVEEGALGRASAEIVWDLGERTVRQGYRARAADRALLASLEETETKFSDSRQVKSYCSYTAQRQKTSYLRFTGRVYMWNNHRLEAANTIDKVLQEDHDNDIEFLVLQAECDIYTADSFYDIANKVSDRLVRSAAFTAAELILWATWIVEGSCSRIGFILILDAVRKRKEKEILSTSPPNGEYGSWATVMAFAVGWFGYQSITSEPSLRLVKLKYVNHVLERVSESSNGVTNHLIRDMCQNLCKYGAVFCTAGAHGREEQIRRLEEEVKTFKSRFSDAERFTAYGCLEFYLGYLHSKVLHTSQSLEHANLSYGALKKATDSFTEFTKKSLVQLAKATFRIR